MFSVQTRPPWYRRSWVSDDPINLRYSASAWDTLQVFSYLSQAWRGDLFTFRTECAVQLRTPHMWDSQSWAPPWGAEFARCAPAGFDSCPSQPPRAPGSAAPPGSSAPWRPSPALPPGSPNGTGSPPASAAAHAGSAPAPKHDTGVNRWQWEYCKNTRKSWKYRVLDVGHSV